MRALVAPLCAALAIAPSWAQDFPNRPVRVIVPFSPGGAVDGPTRVVAQELSKRLGQQVVIDNRPGAGATIGTDAVAKAPPDGYTLLLASQTNAISATLYTKLSFNPIDDFAPISLIGREPGVVVVHPSLPVKTVQELIELARSQPGQIDYASSGNGSGQHLFAAQLFSMAGVQLNHVLIAVAGDDRSDRWRGQGQRAGRGIRTSGAAPGRWRRPARTVRRNCLTPTLAESGYPGHSAYVWLGLLAPKGTPAAIIDMLNREIWQRWARPRSRATWPTRRSKRSSTSAEFGTYFRAERDTRAWVIQTTGAKLD